MAPTPPIDRHKALADWFRHTRATARKQGVPERHVDDFMQDWAVAMLTEKEPSPKLRRRMDHPEMLLVRCARWRAWRKLRRTMETEPAASSTTGGTSLSPMSKRAHVPDGTPANLKSKAYERLQAMRDKQALMDEGPQEDVCR